MKNHFFAIAFISLVTFGFNIYAEDKVTDNAPDPVFKSVTEDDVVFFRLESYDLTKVNLPICPYFSVYEWDGAKRGNRVCCTGSKEKFAITPKVENPSNYKISIPKDAGKSYVFYIFSNYDWDNEIVAGNPIASETFMDWNDPNRSYELEISPGNKIVLRFERENNNYLYYQIESFAIAKPSDSYLERLKDTYQMQVRYSHIQKNKEQDVGSFRLRNFDLRIEDIPVDFEYKTDFTIEFFNKTLGTLATFSFNAKTLYDNLKKGNEEYILKNDKQNVQCKLLFNGIRRVYRIKTLDIPPTAPIRAKQRPLLAGEDPKLYVWVQENGRYIGKNQKYALPGIRRAWSVDFPDEEGNRFVIREGTNHTYAIHIEDHSPWFDSPMVANFIQLTFQSFKNEVIIENATPMLANGRRIRVLVEEVKTK